MTDLVASQPKAEYTVAQWVSALRKMVPDLGIPETAAQLCKSVSYIDMLWTIAQVCPQEWIENKDLSFLELQVLARLIKRGYSIDLYIKQASIVINGTPFGLKTNTVSYETLVGLAECPGGSVTYRKVLSGDASRNGLLSKGQSVGDVDGMIFDITRSSRGI